MGSNLFPAITNCFLEKLACLSVAQQASFLFAKKDPCG